MILFAVILMKYFVSVFRRILVCLSFIVKFLSGFGIRAIMLELLNELKNVSPFSFKKV